MAVKNIADDIADYLATQAIGTVGTDIFVSRMVDDPNNQVVVIPTGGPDPNRYVADLHEPTFQIVVRNTDFDSANTKLRAIRAALHNKLNLTLSNHVALFIRAASEGGYIGQDERGLNEFSINFAARVRPT